MKVLLVSASPINRTTSIGNTFLNIMPPDFELASLYTREGLPDSRIAKAYRTSEKMLLSFRPGETVTGRQSDCAEIESDGFQNFAKKHRFSVLFLLRELVWSVLNRNNKGVKKFIEDFDPDLIFTVSTNPIHLNNNTLYALKCAKKPLAIYAWDNNYFDNPYEKSIIKRLLHKREKVLMRRVLESADKVYVISGKQKEDYEKEFGFDCSVLTKYDIFDTPFCYRDGGEPVEFVYTGNLGVERWKTIGQLASSISRLNRDGVKAVLKIYSYTALTGEMKDALCIDGSSYFMGSVSNEQTLEIQSKAGVLVHVESFDDENKFKVKYSFSTKIVDYLKTCKPILAIGPQDTASIDYFIKNGSAVVVTDFCQLDESVRLLAENASVREKYAEKAYNCGKANHDEIKHKAEFIRSINELVKKTD